jgi:hypothetical protein
MKCFLIDWYVKSKVFMPWALLTEAALLYIIQKQVLKDEYRWKRSNDNNYIDIKLLETWKRYK